jgi:glycosyltransferase involved in cell wall biosynthesis
MYKQQIWILIDSSKSGGIESHVLQLAKGLQTHEANPLVVFLRDYGEHPLRAQLTQHAINQLTLDGSFFGLIHALGKQRPAMLHTHGYKAGILGRFAARLKKIPVISTYHAGEVASGKLALYDRLDKWTAGLAKHVFAVSPQIAQSIHGKVQIFDNFVNTTDINDSQGQQIAFVGRVSHEKGPDRFADIATSLADSTLHLYGDGPLLNKLTKTAPNNLIFHGQQNNMDDVWSRIGLLVIPSRYEGLPMAALEAMARGIPVVAFQVGALDKLINNNHNGWLIKPDSIEKMCHIIMKWQTLSQLEKQKISTAAKQTIATKFSNDVAIPKLITRYQQCVNQ